ncbi:MAG: HD domain-containing protein, partial [Lachnospiraceae bacterium]|nr:HD domain-containing protein [Lachnospiraceae bacterium]
LESLQIATGDEIENLYESLSMTMSQTVGYIDDVQKKGEEISHMQNGLIYILADLVESRDKCTGDHVRKTAAYVKLILQLMKEQNVYSEMLTDEYVQDVCNSAPLHDVGKIKVSDVILNKPARLTDEEFEIMKNHTLAGKEVIESAMKLTTDTGYLKEALNLATYHHEKWDGSGYPMGLAGEDIPLSARIMAISDVFDALVSNRSYKKAFTFEEAMKIIEEGEGTHFDPILAKLFVENQDRVREIMEENKKLVE